MTAGRTPTGGTPRPSSGSARCATQRCDLLPRRPTGLPSSRFLSSRRSWTTPTTAGFPAAKSLATANTSPPSRREGSGWWPQRQPCGGPGAGIPARAAPRLRHDRAACRCPGPVARLRSETATRLCDSPGSRTSGRQVLVNREPVRCVPGEPSSPVHHAGIYFRSRRPATTPGHFARTPPIPLAGPQRLRQLTRPRSRSSCRPARR